MVQTSVTVNAQDAEAARREGARLLAVLPEEVDVLENGPGIYGVSVKDRPGRFELLVSADAMTAFLERVVPPLGQGRAVTLEDVLAELAEKKIVYGVDEDLIAGAVARVAESGSEESHLCIAMGAPARDGVDAALHFKFRMHGRDPAVTDKARKTGVIPDKGIARELLLAGDPLVQKTPIVPAENGCTVTGETIMGKPPVDLPLTAGDNVAVSDDALVFSVADTIVAGYADYSDGVVSVRDPVRVSEDSMRVFLEIHPPGMGGRKLDGDLLERILAQHAVVHGVNWDAFRKAIAFAAEKKRILYSVVIAKGSLPVPGRDAEVELHVPVGQIAGLCSDENDSIDFRERNIIRKVKAGDVLARKIPLDEGINGHDVLGRVFPAEAGKDKPFLAQANVAVSEDGLLFTAETGGMVSMLDGGKIAVFQVYEVKGDVDYDTGNLDMEGTVQISGWVRSGFTVRASGDIVINGGVEDAVVSAGANLVIGGGVVGLEHGRVKAKGDISVKFLERARVSAGGDIAVHDEMMRSIVTAAGRISAVSGKGRIRGGAVSGFMGIEANEVGSEAGVKTVIMAGTNPVLKRRIAELNKQINGYRRERAKMDTVLGRYLAKGEANLPRDTARKLAQLGKQRRNLVLGEARLAKARDDLGRDLDSIDLNSIAITIKKVVYAGTAVVIGEQIYKVSEDIRRPVSFTLDESGKIAMR